MEVDFTMNKLLLRSVIKNAINEATSASIAVDKALDSAIEFRSLLNEMFEETTTSKTRLSDKNHRRQRAMKLMDELELMIRQELMQSSR